MVSRANAITPAYARKHRMPVGPLEGLAGHPKSIPVQGIGGLRTQALGYVVFRVQVEWVPSYNENQCALVLPDDTDFGRKVPVILGTPTINRLVRSMKESEFETAPEEWQYSKWSYEHVNQLRMHKLDLADTNYPTNTWEDPTDLDERVLLRKKLLVPAFETVIVHGTTERTMMMGHRLNVMTQAPYPEDQANLPNGLVVQRVYTDLRNGSRNVALAVRNVTSRTIFLAAGKQIGRVVTANEVPEAWPSPELLRKLEEEDTSPGLAQGDGHQGAPDY